MNVKDKKMKGWMSKRKKKQKANVQEDKKIFVNPLDVPRENYFTLWLANNRLKWGKANELSENYLNNHR